MNSTTICQIKPASLGDLGELRKLEQVCFGQDSWPLFDLLGVLTFPGIIRLKAVVNGGGMAGFAAGERKPEEDRGWVTTIGVRPEFRHQGIGRALLEAVESGMGMERVRLCVRKTNREAIRMYEAAGYQHVGAWPEYYAGGEDALVMEKTR